MIGLSWTEMLIIGVFALIFIGPKELPVIMQRLGKVVGTIRRMGNEFQRELNRSTGLDQVADLRRSITEPLKKTTAEIAKEFNRTTPTGTQPTGVIKPADPKVESVVSEIHAAAGGAVARPAPTVADSMKAAVQSAVAEKAPVKTGTAGKTPPADTATKPKRTRKAAAANGADTAPPAPAAAKPAARKKAPVRTHAAGASTAATPAATVATPAAAPAPKAPTPRRRKSAASAEPAPATDPAAGNDPAAEKP